MEVMQVLFRPALRSRLTLSSLVQYRISAEALVCARTAVDRERNACHSFSFVEWSSDCILKRSHKLRALKTNLAIVSVAIPRSQAPSGWGTRAARLYAGYFGSTSCMAS